MRHPPPPPLKSNCLHKKAAKMFNMSRWFFTFRGVRSEVLKKSYSVTADGLDWTGSERSNSTSKNKRKNKGFFSNAPTLIHM